jgi:hypothetical protein
MRKLVRALRGREQSQEMGWAMMLVAVPNGLKGGKKSNCGEIAGTNVEPR